MPLVLNDRVLETSTTQGTGSFSLNGPPSSYQSFNAGIGTGNTTFYAIFNTAADEWETGIGTLTGATTLARTTVLQSSNADALVNFSVGTKNVFCTLPSQRSVFENELGNVDGFPITNCTVNGTPIGGTTAAAGAFTTLSASSTVSGVGFSNYLASPPTIGNVAPNTGSFTSLAATSLVDTSVLGRTGARSADTSIAATVTYTTGGRTLANQTAAAGTTWRVRAFGDFVAVNSATARNAQIAAFWGATQLTAISSAVVISVAQTTGWMLEFIINGTSATNLWVAGALTNRLASASISSVTTPASANVTVASGAQTLDLRFSMSVAVAGDSWTVKGVTMERIS